MKRRDFVTSRDGARIGYRCTGRGPGIALVQGAMQTVHNYDELARALAADFTVYYADRRGRGTSPCAYDPAVSSIQREVEDVDALLEASGARFLFGLSSGAIITLECARLLPSVQKAIVYEPPFYVRGGVPRSSIERFHDQVARGNLAAALVTVNDIVRLAPGFLQLVPRPLLEMATRAMLRREAKRGAGAYAPLHELLPAMRFDFQVVWDRGDAIALFASVAAPVLVLGGTRSPGYLQDALHALVEILPGARRLELPGLDHSAPWNADRGGAPEIVAQSIRTFLAR